MELMKSAIKNGGKDNITLQLIKFYNIDNKKKQINNSFLPLKNKIIAISAVVAIVVALFGVYFMRQKKLNSVETQHEPEKREEFVKIQITEQQQIPQLLETFNINHKDAIFITANGKNFVQLPIKKTITTRCYDNLITLEKLYGTPAERIKKANKLNSDFLAPGKKLIIPY